MEGEIILKGRIEKKTLLLNNPELYTDVPVLCLIIPKNYLPGLIGFSEGVRMESLEITLKKWPINITDRAIKHFFALRDAFVMATQGDIAPDRAYKDKCYRDCVRELDIKKDGKIVDSIKDLDKRQLWQITELMMQYCLEAGADIRNLSHAEIQKELKG